MNYETVRRDFKGVGSTQTSIFSLNTVFHSLHYSQESLRHFFSSVFFDICPPTALLHQSLKSSNGTGNRFFSGNYHHISFIQRSKRRIDYVETKDMSQSCLHLQKIVSQPFSANREPHTAIANLNIEKWHTYHQGC